jgi:hypothetical protein
LEISEKLIFLGNFQISQEILNFTNKQGESEKYYSKSLTYYFVPMFESVPSTGPIVHNVAPIRGKVVPTRINIVQNNWKSYFNNCSNN